MRHQMFQAWKFLALYLLSLLGLNSIALAYRVQTSYEEPVYAFIKSKPFSGRDLSKDRQLRSTLTASKTRNVHRSKKVDQYFSFRTNLDSESSSKVKEIVCGMVPALKQGNLAFWKTDLEADGEPELIVEYDLPYRDDPSIDFDYHYLNVVVFRWNSENYDSYYAGPFLFGEIHDVTRFGSFAEKALIIRHQSCFECEPLIYLSVFCLDKVARDLVPFEFDYSKDHTGHDITIEYSLPGMGHSIDASTDTRIPDDHGLGSPSLIQHYIMLNCGAKSHEPDEWWVFKCNGFRCDCEMTDELPSKYTVAWTKAHRLGFAKGSCDGSED